VEALEIVLQERSIDLELDPAGCADGTIVGQPDLAADPDG
jgi:hypothetical protein